MDWKGGWPGCRVKALPTFPSLDYHSARFARLFPPLWSWVPGQTDKEKGAIQTLLGKHNKLVLRKKKHRHDFDICHLHLIAKTLSLENIEKKTEKERELNKGR